MLACHLPVVNGFFVYWRGSICDCCYFLFAETLCSSVSFSGCSIAFMLVKPIVEEPLLCVNCSRANLGALMTHAEAAVAMASHEGCLGALIQLFEIRSSRPTELKILALDTMAAICLGCSMATVSTLDWTPRLIEGIEQSCSNLKRSGAIDVILNIFATRSSSNLSQLRESAGIAMSGIVRCLPESLNCLHERRIVLNFLSCASEEGMLSGSRLRGSWAPRCLAIVEVASMIIRWRWEQCNPADKTGKSVALDCLLEALDSGVVPFLSRLLSDKINFDSPGGIVGQLCLRVHGCHITAAMFGIANFDETTIGVSRLYGAASTDAESAIHHRDSRSHPTSYERNLIKIVFALLRDSCENGQGSGTDTADGSTLELIEASLLAMGSMCGFKSVLSLRPDPSTWGEEIYSPVSIFELLQKVVMDVPMLTGAMRDFDV